MQFTAVSILSALALAGSSLAQESTSGASFYLHLQSTVAKFTGDSLAACHQGAAIEALCVSNTSDVFYLNTTDGAWNSTGPGSLEWYLPASPQGEYETMGLYTDTSTNVAQAMFGLGNQQVVFDADTQEMMIQSNLNDAVTPPTDNATEISHSYWYVCETNFEGYNSVTLNWVYGGGEPHNPSCSPVTVVRELIPPP